MSKKRKKLISVIVPIFNEENNIVLLYTAMEKIWAEKKVDYDFEVIFINDGSHDSSQKIIQSLCQKDKRVKYLEFSKNFGKEVATTAGLHSVLGDAAIMIDADLQHPVVIINEFLDKWEKGAEMVIGVRTETKNSQFTRNFGSKVFYWILNLIGDVQIVPNATDYRLVDRKVIDEFKRFTERNRITRGLLDWLGFQKDYVYFVADERKFGKPGYNKLKLLKLAISTFIAHSLFPLKIAGYIGVVIILVSGPLGLFIFISKFFMGDPFYFSGPAILAVINLFLVGITLSSLGLIALYVGSIYSEVTNRPLYVIRNKKL